MAELANVEHQTATSLYGSMDALSELSNAIKKVAPWANDKDYPMTDYEIGLVTRRAVGMALDPLNPNEIQIWKDKHGIHFQLAKSLITEWVRKFKGDHTEPRYTRLAGEQLTAEGLPATAIAYRCTFFMREDLDTMTTLIKEKFDTPAYIRSMFEVSGIGVAQRQEYDGQYFAPAGRSKSWRVQKRALTDAVTKKFGTPTKAEIEILRRESGADKIRTADWVQAYEVGADDGGTVALAKDAAIRRDLPPMSDEEKRDGIAALYGDDAVDGVFQDESEEPETAPTQADPHWIEDDTTRKKFWAHWTAQGLSNDDVHKALAVEHINTFDGDKKAAVDKINHWVENKMLLEEVSEVMDAD